jgi:AhpD family alkylhydroperoxidase
MLLIYEEVSGFQYLYQKLKRIKWLILLNSTNTVLEWTKNFGRQQQIVKRIFNLDTNAYEGALDVKTQRIIRLVASAVLRCDDCVKYHLETSHKEGVTKEEMMEAMGIATLVGGTIVVPHLQSYEFGKR